MCCASAGAIVLAMTMARPARAQAFQGVPNIVSGDASVSTGANFTQVLVNSDQVVIDWTAGATGSGAIDFLPAGSTALFRDDIYFTGTNFTVLNRILPVDPLTGAAVNQAIAFNGTVLSRIDRTPAGNIWFYSPGGIIAGPTSVFNVGSLVLTTNAIDTTGGLYGTNGEIRFGATTPTPGASIQIQPGAQINAPAANSYVAMVSPRIEQGGDVEVNGSTAYVAAEQADITINNGLFDIQIGVGTDDPNGVVHTGTTGGPATTSLADTQRIYMVAVPKNQALTMLLSGAIGYAPAVSAADEAGAVVLSAGSGVAGGAAVLDDDATADADIAISDADFTSALTGYATDGITVSADGDQVRFEAATSLTARNSASIAIANGGEIDAQGGLSLAAGHGATGGTIDVAVDGAGGPKATPSTLTVNGQLVLDASATAPTGAPPAATGGDAVGGAVTVAATDGGAIAADSLIAHANATGGFGTTREGDATGGAVTIAAANGSSISAGSVELAANAYAQDGSQFGATSLTGGAAAAGTITLSSVDSTIAFASTTLLGEAYGGTGTQTSGDATGGTLAMSVTGADNDWGDLTASANAEPGAAGAGGVAGRGSGGRVTLDVGGGATLALDNASLYAQTQVYNYGNGGGNVQRGGAIGVSAHDGGTLAIDNELDLVADAYGDKYDTQNDTGAAMTAFGGSISVDANGGAITAARLGVRSSAEADGSNGGRGLAQGGDVTIAARNGGTLHLDRGVLSAEARGLNGGYGADATGGKVSLYASDGAITVDSDLRISADATSGGSFNDGVAGGSATGGSVTVENRAGAAGTAAMTFGSLEIESVGDASVPGEGRFFSTGDGGRGVGGTIAISLAAGAFNVPELDVYAAGYGGSAVPAYGGGDGIGGNVTVTLDGGDATIDTLDLDASGQGALAGRYLEDPTATLTAGDGFGGTVLVNALSGSLTGTDVYLTADGYGGDGGDGFSASKANGGEGHGGSARFVMPADSTANITLDTIAIESSGYGGLAGDISLDPGENDLGGPGSGGDGVGGVVGAVLDGGALDLASLTLAADGIGADGGESDDYNQNAGDGGAGTGGSATLSLGASAATIGTINATATGAGGVGGITHSIVYDSGDALIYGFGSGQGGAGGAGTGGTIDLRFGVDPTLASLVIDASGTGGVGGDGGTGGAGGLGAGGAANLTVNAGPLVINDLLTLDAIGTGGGGGTGATGRGGGGGAATGGSATLTVDGATAALQATGLAIFADAVGGDGGAGGDGTAVVAGAAGGDATGGSATLGASDGGAITFADSMQVSATATGGAGGEGNGGGVGGDGGTAAGGAARVTLDRAVLLDSDPDDDTLDTFVTANAIGGAGGAGSVGAVSGIGGTGGTGAGGTADFSAANSTFVLPIFGVFANGMGGAGGAAGIDDSANPVNGPAGIGGSGRGGAASLSVADDGTGGPAPVNRSLAELAIAATGSDGASPDLVSVPDAGVAGAVAITNSIVGTNPGLTIRGDLDATALGASAPAGSGISFTSNGAPVTVAGGAFFATDGDASFTFAGPGALAVDGDMTAAAAGSIGLVHTGQAGSASDSIRAAAIVLDAGGDVTGGLGSVLRATDPDGYVIVRGGGSVAVGDVVAPTDVTLSAYGGSLAAGDVTAGDDVWLGAYGGDPAASVTIGDIISTGAGNDAAVTDEALFNGAGPSGQVVRVTGPGSVTTGAILNPDGRTIVVADRGAIVTGDLTAADGIALLARQDVSTGAVTTPSLFYVGDSSMFAPNLPDAYDIAALAGVAPVRTSGGLTIGGPASVGRMIATLGGDATFGAVATSGAATIDSSGAIAGDALDAGGAATLTGNRGIALADLASGGDLILRASAGAVIVSHDLTSTGSIDAVAQSIDLTAQGALALANATATAGDLRVTSGGDLSVTNGAASGDVALASGGSLEGQTVAAGGDATLDADGAVTVASLSAGGVVRASGTDIDLTSPGALTVAEAKASDGDLKLTTAGNLSVTTGAASGDIALVSGDAIAGQTLNAGGDAMLDADGAVTVASLSAGGVVRASGTGVDLSSPGALTVVEAEATNGDLSLTTDGALAVTNGAASGDIALVSGGALAGQTLKAGGDATLDADGAVTVASLSAGGVVRASGTNIDLTSPGALTVAEAKASDGDLKLTTAGNLSVMTGAASGDIALVSGDAIAGQTLNAGGDAMLDADGAVTVASLSAGGVVRASGTGIDLSSPGALTVVEAEATNGDLSLTTDGALTVTNGAASGDIALVSGDAIAGQVLSAGGDATLDADGKVAVANLSAGGVVRASGAAIDLSSPGALTVAEANASDGDLKLATLGDLAVAEGSASGDIALASNGSITGQKLTASNIRIVAERDATLGSMNAARDLTIDAEQTARFTGLVSAATIAVSSNDIAINEGAQLGVAGTTDSVDLTAIRNTSPAVIGGDGGGDGYTLSAAEMGRLFAHDISITATGRLVDDSLDPSTPPDIIVRDFTLAAGASGNIAADGSLTIAAPGTMRIEGAAALTGLDSDGGLRLAADDAIELIAGAGSIDLRDADGNLGGTLDFDGGTFIAATDAAIADVADATTIAERDARLAQSDGLALDDGMIRAGTIRLSVSDGAFIQNSGAGTAYDQRRGFTANAIDIATSSPNAQLVLNGRLTGATAPGGFAQGLAVIPLLMVNGAPAASGGAFDAASTANGCVIIDAATCAAATDDSSVPSHDQIDGQINPSDGVNNAILTPTTLVSFEPFEPAGYPPLIDEPVTGVGNSDLWIPDCPPGRSNGQCSKQGSQP